MSRKSDYEILQVEFVESIAQIDSQAWNRLAGDESPFLRHEFFLALEQSGCTSRATGWQPYHAVVRTTDKTFPDTNRIVALVPLFLKYNSFGEYVFDWSWADAYRAAGLQYYPKFLTAIPFTPSAASRLLHEKDVRLEDLLGTLILAIKTQAELKGASSWHVLFPSREESEVMGKLKLRQRKGCQFHWFNRNYVDFDDYLQALSSRKRKNMRKERSTVSKQGIEFDVIEGPQVSEQQWVQFYRFYQSTYLVRGREGYLNQAFFLHLSTSMPENLVLVLARLDQQTIAGALFFKSRDKLYGRYWGSLEEYQMLHFETCFYQGIQYCIEHQLQEFDAGAQGEHKIQRGFEPIETWSNHWIANEPFADAIENFLQREAVYIDGYITEASKLLPFKKV